MPEMQDIKSQTKSKSSSSRLRLLSKGVHKFKYKTDMVIPHNVISNTLATKFNPDKLNIIWIMDIIYIKIAESWLSLPVIIDLY